MPRQPDATHDRPEGVDDATVDAVGKIREAFELLLRARGALYAFHQQIGYVDDALGEGLEQLRAAGHHQLAAELSEQWLGRNALRDRWTFEIVEDFDDTYFDAASRCEQHVRELLMDGRRHVQEAERKAGRREDGPTEDV